MAKSYKRITIKRNTVEINCFHCGRPVQVNTIHVPLTTASRKAMLDRQKDMPREYCLSCRVTA